MCDDHNARIPGPDIETIEHEVTEGERLIGYAWIEGKKVPVTKDTPRYIRIPYIRGTGFIR